MTVEIYDFIGVGTGPSQISLAIALEETFDTTKYNALYLDSKEKFGWHSGWNNPHAQIQMSFLKDLVTLRNPRSNYSFLSYAKQQGRLEAIASMADYVPSRVEYEMYLNWVLKELDLPISFSSKVLSIEPYQGVDSGIIQVRYVDGSGTEKSALTRSISIASGKVPKSIDCKVKSPRLVHTSKFAKLLPKVVDSQRPLKVAVVGAGQSAAEVALSLLTENPDVQVHCYARSFLYKSVDANPYVNDLYTWSYAQRMRKGEKKWAKKMHVDLATSNYGVVDNRLLEKLYNLNYHESIHGINRLHINSYVDIESIEELDDYLRLNIKSHETNTSKVEDFDYVVLATGFGEDRAYQMIEPFKEYLKVNSETGEYQLNEDYSLSIDSTAKIIVHNYNDHDLGFTNNTITSLALRAKSYTECLKPILGSSDE